LGDTYIEYDACLPSTMDICDMKKGLDAATAASSESSKHQNKLIE
jgi:hypothetical protein